MNSSRKGRKGRKEHRNERTTLGIGKTVYDSFNPVLKANLAEVNQQTKFAIAQPKLGKNLFAMDGGEFLHRFQFHNDFFLNQEIGAKSLFENEIVIMDRDRYLAFDAKVLLPQFVREEHFVNAFEQTWPRSCVNLECSIENDSGQLVFTERDGGVLHRQANCSSPENCSSSYSRKGCKDGRGLRSPLRSLRSSREE